MSTLQRTTPIRNLSHQDFQSFFSHDKTNEVDSTWQMWSLSTEVDVMESVTFRIDMPSWFHTHPSWSLGSGLSNLNVTQRITGWCIPPSSHLRGSLWKFRRSRTAEEQFSEIFFFQRPSPYHRTVETGNFLLWLFFLRSKKEKKSSRIGWWRGSRSKSAATAGREAEAMSRSTNWPPLATTYSNARNGKQPYLEHR